MGGRDMALYSTAQLLGGLAGAGFVKILWGGWARSVFCAKLFHTDRYRCHLADCRFAGSHPSVGVASRKEDLP